MTEALGRAEPDEELAVGLERWVSVSTGRVVAEGRVDRIDRRGDELVIVDYKTGRHTADRRPTRAASPALALYAVATERTLRRACRQVELHHLPSGDGGRLAARRRVAGRARAAGPRRPRASWPPPTDALAAGGDPDALFPARPAPRCAGCPMRRSCPEGRAVGPEAAPWAMLAP